MSKHAQEVAREKIIGAVLNKLSADHDFTLDPGSYGAMASAELADELLDDALRAYVDIVTPKLPATVLSLYTKGGVSDPTLAMRQALQGRPGAKL